MEFKTISKEQRLQIINAFNDRSIQHVYVESHMENGIEKTSIRIRFYSGSDQTAIANIDKREATYLISEIQKIITGITDEKFRHILD